MSQIENRNNKLDRDLEVENLKAELSDRFRELGVLTRLLEIEKSSKLDLYQGTMPKNQDGEHEKHRGNSNSQAVNTDKVKVDLNTTSDNNFNDNTLENMITSDYYVTNHTVSALRDLGFSRIGNFVNLLINNLSKASDEDQVRTLLGQLLLQSHLFDPQWYLTANPDVAVSKIDALEHYLIFGCLEGRNIFSDEIHSDEENA